MIATRSGFRIAALVLLSAGTSQAQSQGTTTTPPPPAEAAPAPGAVPQEPPAAGTPAPGTRSMEEQIIVTGSRTRRKDLTTPAPVTVLTREQFQQSGKLTIGEFLQTLPEQGNAPNFQLNNGGINYNTATGSTNVNLRSLGVTRTLVLVNGRRMVPAGVGASPAVDLNSIPSASVERIEVLKDGASAIYGSDAIAGVVNIITRKNYRGTEAAVQYGVAGHGDAQTIDAQVTTGSSGDWGNFVFSAGYFNQGDSWLRDRTWSSQALTYDYNTGTTTSGGSFRTPQGTISLPADASGNPLPGCTSNALCMGLINAWRAANPSDPNGWTNQAWIRVPSVADRNSVSAWKLMTDADTYNFAAENYLTIPSTRVQAYSGGDTHFSLVRGYYEASYVQRNTTENAAPMPLNPGDYTVGGGSTPISVSADSVYNPFGVDLPFAGRRLVEFGHRTYGQELATFRVVTGVDGTLPESAGPLRNWYWNTSINYGRTSGTFTTEGAIRNSRIADAVGPSMKDANGVAHCVKTPGDITTAIPGCVPLDLFGGPNNGSIDPAQIAGLGFTGTSRAFDAMFAVNADVTGELFNIGSDRPVSLALGYEFRRQDGSQIADPIAASGDSADFNFQSTSGYYYSNEAYGELTLPLLSNITAVHDLEASVAGRFVDYNTFGTNFTYKFGLRYSPIMDFTVRGTYSTAFRAPTIGELYLGQQEVAPVATDPCNFSASTPQALKDQCIATGVPAGGSGDQGNQELARIGGNPNLQPETAKIFTAGVVFQPRIIRNFSLTVDYYNTTVDDRVDTIGVPGILAGCYPAASGSTATPVPSYCNNIHRASNGRILFINDTNQNVGQLKTAGVDLAIRYALPSPIGRWGFAFDGTWLAYYDRTQVVGTETVTIKGRGNYDLGALPATKFNVGLNWSMAGFTLGGIGHYVSSFKECGAFDSSSGHVLSAGGLCYVDSSSSRDVGAYFAVDFNASYTLTSQVGRTTLLLGLNNAFDKAPQYVYSAALANSDPSVYDYVGRFFYGRVAHTF
jgi:outer membrane receptor protein involved in Fe transport